MSVKVTDHTSKIAMTTRSRAAVALRNIGTAIDREAFGNTPKRTGRLRESPRVQVSGLHGKVTWTKEYAAYQERGKRKDGSHVVTKYSHGGGSWFAKNAAEKVAADASKYFRGARVI